LDAGTERQSDWSYLDLISDLQRGLAGNRISVDDGSALAAQVFYKPSSIIEKYPAMTSRHLRVAQNKVDFGRSTDNAAFAPKHL
jgi:hypothetical protein